MNALRPGNLGRDLERELGFHLRERIDELCDQGLSPADAERRARLQFGNLTAQLERTREVNINTLLESALRNVRLGFRVLRKTPAFTAAAILTLALGIGANSAVFSAIYAVLLHPLPFPNGDQLVTLPQSHPGLPESSVAPARLEDWNRLNHTLQGVTGYYTEDASEVSGDYPQKIKRAWVAPRFLQVLGISPALGRDFTPQEESFGGPSAVLISYRFWQQRFGGDPAAVGKILRLTAARAPVSSTITGILPASFGFPTHDVDVWAVMPPNSPYAQNREATWFTVIGRLRAGVSLSQARTDLAAVQANLGRLYPKTDAVKTVSVNPLKEVTVGGVRRSLWLLFGSVTLLLLIACANLAALLLSRAAARQHEISVRFSLGASRAAIAGQLLTEVFLLAVTGALSGLLVAVAASRLFRTLAKDLPRVEEIGISPAIIVYALTCAVAATLLCGVLPAIRGTRGNTSANLARGARTQVAGRNPLQLLLVGVQVALAVTLLTGAGLLVRSFQELGRVAPGFDPRHVLVFHVSSTWAEAGGEPGRQLTSRILEGLGSLPGVDGVTLASGLPGVPGDYSVELKSTDGQAESELKINAQQRWVSPAYFSVMGIPILEGQLCHDSSGPPTAMVNRTFADRYLNGSGAIGRHIMQTANSFLPPVLISGITGDARETGLSQAPPPTLYVCAASVQPNSLFLLRVHGDPASYAGTMRARLHQVEPLRSLYGVTPLTALISDGYAENRLRTVLLAFFALTAIALASVGLYGTLSYVVSVRRREVALRMALGASKATVAGQFLTQGLVVTTLGCLAGLALSAAFVQTLSNMLYGVAATDLATLGGVIVMVLAISAVASLLPAVRAARLDPMQALREE